MTKQYCIDLLIGVFLKKTGLSLSSPIINVHTVYAAPKKRHILSRGIFQANIPYTCWWDLEKNAYEVDIQALLLDYDATKDSTLDTLEERIPAPHINAAQGRLFDTLARFHINRIHNPPQNKTEASDYTKKELSILLHAFIYQTERSYQNPFKPKKNICSNILCQYTSEAIQYKPNRKCRLSNYQNCKSPIFELTSGSYDPRLHKHPSETTNKPDEAARSFIDAFIEALSHFNKQFHMVVQTETLGLQDELLMVRARGCLAHLNETFEHIQNT